MASTTSDTSNSNPLSSYIIMLVIAGLLIIFAVVSFSYVYNYSSHPYTGCQSKLGALHCKTFKWRVIVRRAANWELMVSCRWLAAGAKALAPVATYEQILVIRLGTRFSKFKEIGLKTPFMVYATSLTIAIIWGGIVSYFLFSRWIIPSKICHRLKMRIMQRLVLTAIEAWLSYSKCRCLLITF